MEIFIFPIPSTSVSGGDCQPNLLFKGPFGKISFLLIHPRFPLPLPIYKPTSQPGTQSIGDIVAIASGKGGVGKSTVAVHLARELHRKGRSVGLLDADLYGPSLRKMLPEQTLPKQEGDVFFPAKADGISLISMGYFRRVGEPASVRAPIANRLIGQFLEQTLWGKLDILLIDFPPGTGDIQMTLAQKARFSGALLVTTPQEIATMDVRKSIELFNSVRVPLLGLAENMSYYHPPESSERYYPFGRGGGKRLAEEYHIPLLAELPLDPLLGEACETGAPLSSKSSPILEALRTLTTRLELRLTEEKSLSEKIPEALRLRSLHQKDDSSFQITWGDGVSQRFLFSSLQKNCPCAGCQASSPSPRTDVGVTLVAPVGRYAIRCQFTSGCSHGIFDYSLLRQLGETAS